MSFMGLWDPAPAPNVACWNIMTLLTHKKKWKITTKFFFRSSKLTSGGLEMVVTRIVSFPDGPPPTGAMGIRNETMAGRGWCDTLAHACVEAHTFFRSATHLLSFFVITRIIGVQVLYMFQTARIGRVVDCWHNSSRLICHIRLSKTRSCWAELSTRSEVPPPASLAGRTYTYRQDQECVW